MNAMVWSTYLDEELMTSLSALIKNNNGEYRSDKQAAYFDTVYPKQKVLESHTSYLNTHQIDDITEFIGCSKYEELIFVSGEYHIYRNIAPVVIVFKINYSGVVAKYKCFFKRGSRHVYIYDEVKCVWFRE